MNILPNEPKKHGLDYSLNQGINALSKELKKGYLKRRDVTELIDHIKEGALVKAQLGENGIQWTINNSVISPNTPTNKTPFWIRRIVHFFTWNSAPKLEGKIQLIKKAYEDLINEEKNKKLQALEAERAELDKDIYSLCHSRIDFRTDLEKLTALDERININFFGSWTLSKDEISALEKLEKSLFKQGGKTLTEKEVREEGKSLLNRQIKQASNSIDEAGEQRNVVTEKITNLKTHTFTTLNALNRQTTIRVSSSNYPLILEGITQVEVLDDSPLFNRKALFNSILSQDDFYKNSLLPALKGVTSFLTSNAEEANALYSKWDNQIQDLALTWENSQSNEEINDLIAKSPSGLLAAINGINKFTNLLCYEKLSIQDVIATMAHTNISETFNLDIQIPPNEAALLLETSKSKPENLFSLFSDPVIETWPIIIQQVIGFAAVSFQSYLQRLEVDSNYRQSSLCELKRLMDFVPSSFLISSAEYAIKCGIFDSFIQNIPKKLLSLIPSSSETEMLIKMQNKLPALSPEREALEQAIKFSKTKKRKDYIKKKEKLLVSILTDIFDSFLSKHTPNDSEIGKNGKEYNLDQFGLLGLNTYKGSKEANEAMIAWLEALDHPTPDQEDLEIKKSKVIATDNHLIRQTFKMAQSAMKIPASSPNIQRIIQTLDEKVIPDVVKNPLDIETTPLQAWLQQRVLRHFGEL